MSVLNRTPLHRLVDREGRPYFLWDTNMSLDAFREALRDPDLDRRSYLVGKLMRQAKPDDVFGFVSLAQIRELWPLLVRYLGRTAAFWTWLLDAWSIEGHGDR